MTTSDYKKLSARECAEALLSIERPLVMIHVRPDGDAVGSGAALCEIFRQFGRHPRLICADAIPKRLDFILDMCSPESLANDASGYDAVSIDVASPAQLGSLYSEKTPPILMIDHHAVGEMFADGYIDPAASSAAEALFDITDELIALGKIQMNDRLAIALYAAISSDTGRFCFSNTSSKTHMRAAELLSRRGIDFADINNRLFFSKSESQIRAEGFVGASLKTEADGRIAYASVTLSDIEELGLCTEDFETAIDIVRSLSGCEIAIFTKEISDGTYKISLRSTGANVAEAAKAFGGGGHIRAAGCTIKAENASDALASVLCEIKRII